MKKAIFIVGPTAVGKTDLVLSISKKIRAAIINADSVQVYKGLDIISGKDLPPDSIFKKDHYHVNQTPLYLLDIAEPSAPFSVFNFVNFVKSILPDVTRDRRIPMIVGGTRFYIEALTKKIDTLTISPDPRKRAKLEKLTVEDLQNTLKEMDSHRFRKMNNSDKNNKRRLIRAIEVAQAQGRTLGTNEQIFKENEVLMIGLTASYENLKKRISARLDARIKQGAIDEAKKLFKNYKNLTNQIKSTNGYKQLFEYLRGNISLEDATRRWKFSEYHLAKRQISWIRSKKNIHLFDIEKKDFKIETLRIIKRNFPQFEIQV